MECSESLTHGVHHVHSLFAPLLLALPFYPCPAHCHPPLGSNYYLFFVTLSSSMGVEDQGALHLCHTEALNWMAAYEGHAETEKLKNRFLVLIENWYIFRFFLCLWHIFRLAALVGRKHKKNLSKWFQVLYLVNIVLKLCKKYRSKDECPCGKAVRVGRELSIKTSQGENL